jgi:hypothetical protein
MVSVRVRDDDGVKRAGVEAELAIRAIGVEPVGIEQAAVEQDPVRSDLQEMGRSRHLTGSAMERNAQTTFLPKVPSTALIDGYGAYSLISSHFHDAMNPGMVQGHPEPPRARSLGRRVRKIARERDFRVMLRRNNSS